MHNSFETDNHLRIKIVRLFEIIDQSQWDCLDEVFHPDAEYNRPGYQSINGYQRICNFYRCERIISSGKHVIENIIVDSPHVACCGTFIGELKNHMAVEERFADIYSFVDGLIRTRRTFFFRPAI